MKPRLFVVAALVVTLYLTLSLSLSARGSQVNDPNPSSPAVALGQPGLSFRYVRTFGVTEQPYFADAIHVNHPVGLFMDASNNLYVTEEQGYRILRYNSSGSNTLTIGKAGMSYTDDYVFSEPRDTALDNSGNIWVVDVSRVVQYSSTGTFLQQLPSVEPWVTGNDDTHFDGARSIAFDSVGRMYVSDSNNHRVQVYDLTGGSPVYSTTIGVTGGSGSDNSHFNSPFRLAVDSSNRLYVADAGNNRVQRCTFGGTWACTTLDGGLNYPQGIAVDNSNNVYIADTQNGRIRKCTSGGSCSDLATGTYWLYDVAVDSTGNVYGTAGYEAVVVKYNSSGALVGPFVGVEFAHYLTDNYHYNYPRVAVDKVGNIIIIEEHGHRLVKLNPGGTALWTVGVPGVEANDNSHFNWPHGVAVDKNGTIYVADGCRVQIFSGSGSYIATLGTGCGTGDYQFNWAAGIAVDDNNYIYVSDASNHRVQVYNNNRVFVGRIGTTGQCGSANDRLCWPIGLEVDSAGNIYVADAGNARVQKFNSTRQWQMTLGTLSNWGDSFSQFNSPEDIALDSQGRIYVADIWNNRVQVFDSSGAYLTTIGGAWGSNNSQFRGTSGVAVDSAGNVYVADFGNARIQKFAPGVPGWRQSNLNGFGDRRTEHIPSLATFGNYLYAGTANYTQGSFVVWRTMDGKNWQQMNTNLSGGISSLAAFNGYLYAGTWNGTVWRSPNGLSWTNVITGGLGNSGQGLAHLTVYSNTLYAGTYCDDTTGGEIWQTTNGTTWTPLVTNGLGHPNNCGVISSAAFGDRLYFGIGNWNGPQGAQIWRTNGITVTAVITDGFGVPTNKAPGGLAAFNGVLYASVSNANGIQVWRSNSANAGTWTQVVSNGFGNLQTNDRTGLIVHDAQLYLVAQNSTTGIEIWRTSNGTNWEQVGFAGFGDSNNEYSEWSGATALFENNLFIGITNFANGGEVWQLLKQVYLPLVLRN